MSETVEQTVRRVGNRIVISTIKKEDMNPKTVSQSGVINTATDTVTASIGLNWGEIGVAIAITVAIITVLCCCLVCCAAACGMLAGGARWISKNLNPRTQTVAINSDQKALKSVPNA